MSNKAILALACGDIFEGLSFGVGGTRVGELVFNTSISGYQEILTDPSYCKQIVTLTYPHIGNVGTNEEDNESHQIWASGLVVRQFQQHASNYRHQLSLNEFLSKHNVVAIGDVDTRQITHILRDKGAQGACITTDLSIDDALAKAREFAGLEGVDLASFVSTKKSYQWQADRGEWGDSSNANSDVHIVAYDFGIKHNILRLLTESGFNLTVVNAKTSAEDVLKLKPDGVFLSNGPGDPFACDYVIDEIKQLIEKKIPMFGICLGFQLLCLALGAKTEKMKFGHHGANHPVIDLATKRVLITSQNHGFMVSESSLPAHVKVTHRSLFDNSLQGIATEEVFGLQGHPEASPGPHDAMGLFEQFKNKITSVNKRREAC